MLYESLAMSSCSTHVFLSQKLKQDFHFHKCLKIVHFQDQTEAPTACIPSSWKYKENFLISKSI